MSNSATLASSSSRPVIRMDPRLRQLLKACSEGDVNLCINLIISDTDILFSTTPHKNNCLHIATMLGHHEFAREVWSRAPSLLFGTNIDGETPLIAALMAANLSLASDIITAATQFMQHNDLEEGRQLNCMLLKIDRRHENALHHAMRNGFENFALQLLDIEPRLSEQVTNTGESPMYMAARRGYSEVVERLLQIPSSANSHPRTESVVERLPEIPSSVDCGAKHEAAMHAAVRFGQPGVIKQLLERQPQLAYIKDKNGLTPLKTAVLQNNLMLVMIFLEFDPNLAYIKDEQTEFSLFIVAAREGFVSIANKIMRASPDSVYTPCKDGYSALHYAIVYGNQDFINYILSMPQLHRLVNQATDQGSLPLHQAADRCMPELLRPLLSHKGLDYTAVNSSYHDALDIVYNKMSLQDLKWNESFALLVNVNTRYTNTGCIRKNMEKLQIQEVKLHAEKYSSNTSLVATLLATITFAAAFTLPGGYSADPSDAGLPIFARKAAFQMFLISDTIAMCSSIAVAFLCILSSWEDFDFLLNYRKTTGVLMWCAFVATAVAFGTGLFTVIAPNNLWLAILILVLCSILAILPKIISDLPLLKLRYRTFRDQPKTIEELL